MATFILQLANRKPYSRATEGTGGGGRITALTHFSQTFVPRWCVLALGVSIVCIGKADANLALHLHVSEQTALSHPRLWNANRRCSLMKCQGQHSGRGSGVSRRGFVLKNQRNMHSTALSCNPLCGTDFVALTWKGATYFSALSVKVTIPAEPNNCAGCNGGRMTESGGVWSKPYAQWKLPVSAGDFDSGGLEGNIPYENARDCKARDLHSVTALGVRVLEPCILRGHWIKAARLFWFKSSPWNFP